MASPEIVQLKHEDERVASQLKVLHDAAYQVEADILGLDQFPPLQRPVEAYANARSVFFACSRGGELIGAIEVEASGTGRIEIAGLVVSPRHARQGIGRCLVEHVLAGADSKVIVSTAAGNRPAIAFYENLGFRLVGRWETPQAISMVKFERG